MNNSLSSFGLLLVVALLVSHKSTVAAIRQDECEETRCGKFEPVIRFPFRLKNRQPSHCGYPGFDLSCTLSNQTALHLPRANVTFLMRTLSYSDQSTYLYDIDDRCHLTEQFIIRLNLLISPFKLVHGEVLPDLSLFNCSSNCSRFIYSGFDPIPCLSDRTYSVVAAYSFWVIGETYRTLVDCDCARISRSSFPVSEMAMFSAVPPKLVWSEPSCGNCEAKGQRCRLKKNGAKNETECFGDHSSLQRSLIITCVIVGSVLLMLFAVAIFCACNIDKTERKHRLRIKKFLEDYNSFRPSRYAYSEIKKITNNFKEKLGQGAYGTVFKGKHSNGILVAVKILNTSETNGEEFINEVATMGRIHHVNVVRLVGYCADGFRRALVYEFLPNDSLEKYIGNDRSLSWERLLDIALGIAKGIEYLHQGCDQRILHFDIKPHNILLDQNFTPKISDFGLAKLCSKDKSAVSMNTARGTMGYIAPEVFSRNFGSVSYKSDVYSFGMLLLEMVGGRKNTKMNPENADEVYYPEWIYNLLEEDRDLRILNEEGSAEIAKRLAIVGLWCIQWHPAGRPTMKAVVKMLEGEEELTMPPNPFASVSTSTSIIKTKTASVQIARELKAIAE